MRLPDGSLSFERGPLSFIVFAEFAMNVTDVCDVFLIPGNRLKNAVRLRGR
jgi:hypothetical protein